jgi:hypothetical protein
MSHATRAYKESKRRQAQEARKLNRMEDRIRWCAARIGNDAELDTLLAGASAIERAAMIDRLRPYLRFTPGE